MSADITIKEIGKSVSNIAGASAFSAAGKEPRVGAQAKDDVKAKQSPAGAKDLSLEKIRKEASEIQAQLKKINTDIRFEVSGASKDVVIKIIDHDSGQVIRQIPSEELMAIRERMQEFIGVLYTGKT